MNNQNFKQLQVKINKLKQDKQQLRLFLHELIEAFYKTVNKDSEKETFSPNLEPLFKILNCLKPCCKPSIFEKDKFQPKECAWSWINDFQEKMKGGKHE